MKRSTFGVYQFNQAVGAVVLICVGLFAGALINAGLLKEWFQPSITLRILLPEAGVAGLAPGAEVQVMGTRAGEIRRIVIDPSQRMHAVARIEEQMRPFIRRDLQVTIRRQFGIAGAAFLDISRGTGPHLDWGYAVLTAGTDRAPTDTIGQVVDELRAKIMPLIAGPSARRRSRRSPTRGGSGGAAGADHESAAAVAQRMQRGEGVGRPPHQRRQDGGPGPGGARRCAVGRWPMPTRRWRNSRRPPRIRACPRSFGARTR